ncbi:MAG: carbonic anhydrase, partial [Limisphaerales bacterium]
MKPLNAIQAIVPVLMLVSGCSTTPANKPAAGSARPVHWGYEGKEGPLHWGTLSPVYAACEHSHGQSPIDLHRAGTGTATPLKLDYGSTSLRIAHHEHVIDIVDNGHTIQVTADEGSTLTTGKDTYQLKQFHFHTPSEHTIDGRHFPMEVHFVHQSAAGNFAVVSALFTEGAANENLAVLIAHFPKAKGDANHFRDQEIDLAPHLPANTSAYAYIGSFTTPPCTENVEWFVFREPVQASGEQLKAFADRLNHNNRPVQPSR